jgi:pyridoxal 5'-phosphate synthase pdxT subunit
VAGNALRVGVLALQGDFREHLAVLRGLGADAVPVRRPAELDDIGGLVIPGGESSVMDKLSRAFGMREPIRARIARGMPVYGTCAGLIMLADRLEDAIAGQQTLGGLDATVRRNAFGNQNDSFEADLDIPELGAPAVRAVFIRAPAVEQTGAGVRVLAALPDGRAVAVEQGAILATAFHPEVSGELRFHARFLDRVRAVMLEA